LIPEDLALVETEADRIPDGAYTDPQMLAGQVLRVERTSGDLITSAHLGGQQIELRPDERAIAVEVTDSAGLAGLLKAGDRVGITAVMRQGAQGSYAKMITEGLRVLYVSPEFRSLDPAVYQPDPDAEEDDFSSGTAPRRDPQGVVVLAVPVDAVVVSYDFAPFGVESKSRTISVIDLLPALDQISTVALSLFIQPAEARPFDTSGVYLPDLVVMPGPSPTPTATATGGQFSETPAPTPEGTPVP
jgi:pilus assembly protein CpaB